MTAAAEAAVSASTDPPLERQALGRRLRGVYLLTPDANAEAFDAIAHTCRAAVATGVAAVQYRNKTATAPERRAQASALQAIVRPFGALLIVNDDLALALDIGADGVHLGRDDGDLARARKALPFGLLGASCYDDLDRAAAAVAHGADVLAFGSVFPSSTKPHAVRAPLALLGAARARFPAQRIVAIGGIDTAGIGAVAAAGAHAAAVISAVFEAAEPAAAARQLQLEFSRHQHPEDTVAHDGQRTAV
jgi:thiamine-phosphate pyrophosphorylase